MCKISNSEGSMKLLIKTEITSQMFLTVSYDDTEVSDLQCIHHWLEIEFVTIRWDNAHISARINVETKQSKGVEYVEQATFRKVSDNCYHHYLAFALSCEDCSGRKQQRMGA